MHSARSLAVPGDLRVIRQLRQEYELQSSASKWTYRHLIDQTIRAADAAEMTAEADGEIYRK